MPFTFLPGSTVTVSGGTRATGAVRILRLKPLLWKSASVLKRLSPSATTTARSASVAATSVSLATSASAAAFFAASAPVSAAVSVGVCATSLSTAAL